MIDERIVGIQRQAVKKIDVNGRLLHVSWVRQEGAIDRVPEPLSGRTIGLDPDLTEYSTG